MSKGEIRAALKSGVEPHDLPGAITIGRGADRTAYRVGSYVVKEMSHWLSVREDRSVRRAIRRAGFRVAPTVRVKGPGRARYDLQVMYKPSRQPHTFGASPEITESPGYREAASHGDLHGGNIGIDHRGRYVAFDW